MPVLSINTDDFLVEKNEGDVVTGADWNKLVSLFMTVNNNAFMLLDTIKNVDANAANVAQITQGSVIDGSIGYSKLAKGGGTTQEYAIASELEPKEGVDYYILKDNHYVNQGKLTKFESDTQYFTLNTVETHPAISGADVIANEVIQNEHLKRNTLLASVCSPLLLGGLLSDKTTIYKDRGTSGTFSEVEGDNAYQTKEHTIELAKKHKAVVIVNNYSLIILVADESKPNLFIGSNLCRVGDSLGSSGIYVRSQVGPEKLTAPQSSFKPWPARYNDTIANYPAGLMTEPSEGYVQLTKCVYDYDKQSIYIKFRQLNEGSNDRYPEVDYSFGNLIIGL